jgi:hypothetical protein
MVLVANSWIFFFYCFIGQEILNKVKKLNTKNTFSQQSNQSSILVSWDQHFSLLFEVVWTQNRFSEELSIHFDELTERSWLLFRLSKFIDVCLLRYIQDCSQLFGYHQKCEHEIMWRSKISYWRLVGCCSTCNQNSWYCVKCVSIL